MVLNNSFALFALVWDNMCDHDFMKIKHLFHTWNSKYHKDKVIPNLDSHAASMLSDLCGYKYARTDYSRTGMNSSVCR